MAEKERKPPKDDEEQSRLAMGIALGAPAGVGVVLSLVLDNWGMMGVGVALGLVFGAVPSRKRRAEEDPDTPERDD